MAEERTLGLARAQSTSADDLSKEELQQRMDQARDSISNTVTEIKETVANQVQAVKDTLDWREQFKKRPVVWSASALGVGFCVGYCIAAFVKGDEHDDYSSPVDRFSEESKYYTSQSVLGSAAMAPMAPQVETRRKQENGTYHDEGPGFFQKVA